MERRTDRHQGDAIMTERAAVLGRIREAVKRRQLLTRDDDRERMKLDREVAQQRRQLLSIEASRQRMTRPTSWAIR